MIFVWPSFRGGQLARGGRIRVVDGALRTPSALLVGTQRMSTLRAVARRAPPEHSWAVPKLTLELERTVLVDCERRGENR